MVEQLSIREPFGGFPFGLGRAIGVVLLLMVEQLSILEPFGGLRFGLGGTIGVVLFIDGGTIGHPQTCRRLALWPGRDNWSCSFYRWQSIWASANHSEACSLAWARQLGSRLSQRSFCGVRWMANHWRTILQLAVGCWLAVGWLLAGCRVLVAACEAAVICFGLVVGWLLRNCFCYV